MFFCFFLIFTDPGVKNLQGYKGYKGSVDKLDKVAALTLMVLATLLCKIHPRQRHRFKINYRASTRFFPGLLKSI